MYRPLPFDITLYHLRDNLYTTVLVCPCEFLFDGNLKNLRCSVFVGETDGDSHLKDNLHMVHCDGHCDLPNCTHDYTPYLEHTRVDFWDLGKA